MNSNLITQILTQFSKTERKPAERGHLLALSGAVLIGTDDGHAVVLTPKMARDIASQLPGLASEAEKELPRAV